MHINLHDSLLAWRTIRNPPDCFETCSLPEIVCKASTVQSGCSIEPVASLFHQTEVTRGFRAQRQPIDCKSPEIQNLLCGVGTICDCQHGRGGYPLWVPYASRVQGSIKAGWAGSFSGCARHTV